MRIFIPTGYDIAPGGAFTTLELAIEQAKRLDTQDTEEGIYPRFASYEFIDEFEADNPIAINTYSLDEITGVWVRSES